MTSGYHYHTIVADDEQTLDLIQEELGKLGFLAKLQEYELWISGIKGEYGLNNLHTYT